MRRRHLIATVLAGALPLLAHAQGAGDYPNRPVTIYIGFTAGGPTDVVGRILADQLSRKFGQNFVVDNRAGANGGLAAGLLKKAAPDGYTLMIGSSGTLSISPNIQKNLSYDPVKDFTPIGLIANYPYFGVSVRAAEDASTEVQRLIRSGQIAQASDRLDIALAERPRDPQLPFLLAVVQTDAGQESAAIATFDQLAVDHPELPEPYNNLAVLHASQGDYERARSELEAALRARPGYAVAYQNLGDVYLQLSRQAYQQALALDPSNAAIAPKLALLRDLVTRPPAVSPSSSKPTAP